MNMLEVATLARSWIDTPYHNMAAAKGAGCDCIGLVRGLWAEIYSCPPPSVPVYSPNWVGVDKNDELLLQTARKLLVEVEPTSRGPGIILAFRIHPRAVVQHCGVMTSDQLMVHAHSGRKVYECGLGSQWEPKVVAAFRFPNIED